MSSGAPTTAQLDQRTRAAVAVMARQRGVNDAEYAADAIRRVANEEAGLRDFVPEGVDAADRGDLLSQEEMARWSEERVAARRHG